MAIPSLPLNPIPAPFKPNSENFFRGLFSEFSLIRNPRAVLFRCQPQKRLTRIRRTPALVAGRAARRDYLAASEEASDCAAALRRMEVAMAKQAAGIPGNDEI